jgi:hypothetical protein
VKMCEEILLKKESACALQEVCALHTVWRIRLQK